MSALKATLEQWAQAVKAYDEENYNAALDLFEPIADSAKIHFNIGVILAAAGDHESAIKSYISALYLDQYLAVAYFQKGVSNAKLGDWEAAFDDFNDALLYLRGNLFIDYKQLGLDYKLYSCEILFNRGICYMHLGEEELGRKDFETASKEKQLPDHARVDLTLSAGWKDQPIFKLPRGKLFRPDESKLKNSKKVDYLGKAKLIAAHESSDTTTGFRGVAERKAMQENTSAPIPRSNTLPNALAETERVKRPEPGGLQRVNTHLGNYSTGKSSKDDFEGVNVSQLRRVPTSSARLGGTPTVASPNSLSPTTPQMRTQPDGRPVQRSPSPISPNQRSPSPGNLNPNQPVLRRSPSAGNLSSRNPNIQRSNSTNVPPRAGPGQLGNANAVRSLARANSFDRRPAQNGQLNEMHNGAMAHRGNMANGDEGNWNNATTAVPPGKIKLKCHYHKETRYLLVDMNIDFKELSSRIASKFQSPRPLRLKYRDDDGELVLVNDDEDLDIARGNYGQAEGRATRLELWCFD